jgi:hypothetical protein
MSKIIVQERDRIPSKKIVVIAVTSIVIFAIGVVLSTWVLAARTQRLQPHGPGPLPPLAGEPKIGIVNQFLFETPSEFQDQQRQRLDSYGWVDRARGQVHIPVERAMQMMIQESKR